MIRLLQWSQYHVWETDRNTSSWLSRFEAYRRVNCRDTPLLEMTIPQLIEHLRNFFTRLCKLDGSPYKTRNIHNCLAAISRHLKENYNPENPLDIMSDPRFAPVRRVVDGKMKTLTRNGGLERNAATPITPGEQPLLHLKNSPYYTWRTGNSAQLWRLFERYCFRPCPQSSLLDWIVWCCTWPAACRSYCWHG